MNVTIKSIFMENFKGCRSARHEFGDKTRIFGANATGKSTIFDAFTWLLFGKDSQGNEKFSIRPLDADGKQIDNLEIKVSAVLEIDGREVELTKVQRQNWVKKRGTSEAVMQGNVNSFEIDGYPKAEKDYKAYISEIVSEDLFKMLTSPTYFTGLKWKEQRDILMRFVSDISDYDMAKGKPEFAELLPELQKAPSTDDIQRKYQKSLTEWKKKQGELPVRIDEAEKQKVDIDVAELELHKKAVLEQIASNKEKQDDVSKQFEADQKISCEIMELQFRLGDLQKEANAKLVAKRRCLQAQIDEKNDFLINICNGIQRNNRNIAGYEQDIESGTRERNRLAELWKSVNSEQFDENTAICPTCHRELPQDEREALLSEFGKSKAERLAKIEKDGLGAKSDVENAKEMIPKLQECNKENLANKERLEKEVAELEKQLSELPQSIDISDTEEYKSIQSQIAEKEQEMGKGNSAEIIRRNLEDENRELQSQLTEIEKQLALSQRNVEIDERISELQAEQREVAQKVADQEKMIYLLEQFIRYKMDAISASINSKFDGICFKLFEQQINSGIRECCEVTCGGVPFSSLNAGHKIISGLKIIKALQELYGVYAPVFVDNAEAISKGNLPEMDCQMILLAVSDEKELKVEVE